MLALLDVIFPVFAAPYVSTALLPWLIPIVLVVEIVVIRFLIKNISTGKLIVQVCLANLASWILGMVLASYLPSGLTGAFPVQHGHNWHRLLLLSFPVAFILSVLVEFFVYRLLNLRRAIDRLFLAVLLANAASYIFLGIVLVGFLHA